MKALVACRPCGCEKWPVQKVSEERRDAVAAEFERNFTERGELGASLVVRQSGETIIDLQRGWCEKEKEREWTAETLVPVYSATKGPSAATVLLALERVGLSLEDELAALWPEFPVPDCRYIDVLSHQAGLPALDERAEVSDHEGVIAAVEATRPAWFIGQGHGYHPRTIGFIWDEIIRRVAGCSLAEFWESELRGPLQLDLFMGLPPELDGRVAVLYPGKMDKSDMASGFYREFNTEGTLTRRAFGSPRGLHAVAEMNQSGTRRLQLPAMGGIATARGLAGFYQATLGSEPFSPSIRAAMNTPVVNGMDQTLIQESSFSAGFMMDPTANDGAKVRELLGPSRRAFGHPGAGGSHAFADPENELVVSYVMNQMELAVLPNEKSRSLIRALYGL